MEYKVYGVKGPSTPITGSPYRVPETYRRILCIQGLRSKYSMGYADFGTCSCRGGLGKKIY